MFGDGTISLLKEPREQSIHTIALLRSSYDTKKCVFLSFSLATLFVGSFLPTTIIPTRLHSFSAMKVSPTFTLDNIEHAAASSLLSLGRKKELTSSVFHPPAKRQCLDAGTVLQLTSALNKTPVVPYVTPTLYTLAPAQPQDLVSVSTLMMPTLSPPVPRLATILQQQAPPPTLRRVRPMTAPASKRAVAVSPPVDDGEVRPTARDVLIGTGRTCSSHPGNRRFHQAIYEACPEYFDADYKKGVVDKALATVFNAGGRFLSVKGNKYEVVKDMDRLERNTRKSFHMAKKQRALAKSDNKLKPLPRIRSGRLVGQRIAVYRQDLGNYVVGTVEAESNQVHLVNYVDSRIGYEWLNLKQTGWRLLG